MHTNSVIILQGVSGSGKSKYAADLVSAYVSRNPNALEPRICSADDFFTFPNGSYAFVPSKLPQAHASCLRNFSDTARRGREFMSPRPIIVDNTNTTVAEIAPYYALAQAYEYDVEIRRLTCDPFIAAGRSLHGISILSVERQAENIKACVMPQWWKVVGIEQE